MKRVNQKTKKPFVHGEQRDDGYFFKSYSNKLSKNGYFVEHWHSPKAWENVLKKRQQYNFQNKEIKAIWQKEYNIKNKEKIKAYQKIYNTSEYKKQKNVDFKKQNPEWLKNYYKQYREKNKAKKNDFNAKRKLAKKQQMPKWLSDKDKKLIANFYKEAEFLYQKTGVKHHVDHIVPIKGKNVLGLHVPWNLQILTAEENLKKGNKFNHS